MSHLNVQDQSDDELPLRKNRRGHNISNVSASGNTRMLLGDHHQIIHNNTYYSPETPFFRAKPQKERNKLLVKAALEGQLTRLRYLIDAGADIDAQFPWPGCQLRRILPPRTWTAAGCKIRGQDSISLTALGAAVFGKHVQCINLLLDCGADINSDINQRLLRRQPLFDSPLWISLRFRSHVATRRLLSRGAALQDGMLSLAVRHSTPIAILHMMVDQRTDVNYYNETAEISPALVEAVLLDGEDYGTEPDYRQTVVDFLLGSGANVNARTMEYDDRVCSNSTPLIIATSSGEVRLIAALVQSGAVVDVNCQDSQGYTALMRLYEPDCGRDWVTTNDRQSGPGVTEILKILLNFGADVRTCNNRGTNVMMLIARNSQVEAAEMILQHRLEIDARDNMGMTALMHVLDNWNEERSPALLQLMLSNGADVNLRDTRGKTAFLVASKMCGVEELRLLIAAGADTKAKDRSGRNALLTYLGSHELQKDFPADGGHTGRGFSKVRLFDEAGIDYRHKDNKNRSALMLAARINAEGLVTFLLDKNHDDINARDKSGKTALRHAAKRAIVSNVRILLSRGATYSVREDGFSIAKNMNLIKQGHAVELATSLSRRGPALNEDDRRSIRSLSESDSSDSMIQSHKRPFWKIFSNDDHTKSKTPSADSSLEESTTDSAYSFADSGDDTLEQQVLGRSGGESDEPSLEIDDEAG